MAINLNQQNPNNPQGQQQGPQAAGAQPQQDQFKPRGTGFTNLKSVLGANKNNQLGQTIGAGVQNITNKTQGQTQQAQNQFAKDIGQSVEDIKKGTQVQQNLSNIDFSKNPDEASQKLQEVGGEDYASAAANLRGGYKGPQGFSNQDQLQSQAQQLGQTAQGLMTQGGRQAALQRFVNAGPNYTQGKQQLDTMLLGQNQQALTQARRQAAQTATGTNEALQQAAQQGQATGQQYNTLGQDISGKTAAAGTNLSSALQGQVQAKTQEAQKQVADLQNAVKNGSVTPEQYDYLVKNILGGTENSYNLTNEQLQGMLSANTDYNVSNVATQNELNARNALARLSGATDPNSIVNIDPTKIGTAGEAVKVDNSGYQTQKQAAEAAIQNFNNTTQFGQWGEQGLGGSVPFNYDTAQQIYNQIQPVYQQYQSTGHFYNNPEQAAQYNAILNNLHQQGLTGDLTSDNHARVVGGQNLVNLGNQMTDLNKNYGLGNNLRTLLAQNKNYGVK